VNIDLRSGAVSVTGITPASGQNASQAVMFLKYGDKVFLDVGFLKGEELQTMAMASIVMNIREFDGESVLVQSNGGIEIIGTSDRPRYRILVDLAVLAIDGVDLDSRRTGSDLHDTAAFAFPIHRTRLPCQVCWNSCWNSCRGVH
jgi:hypothetical protein